MTLLDNFPHTATVKSPTYTQDAQLGERLTLSGSDTPTCWKQHASSREIQEFEKQGYSVTHKFLFPEKPTLSEKNVLVHDGEEYEVRIVDGDRSAGLGFVWRVMTERISSK